MSHPPGDRKPGPAVRETGAVGPENKRRAGPPAPRPGALTANTAGLPPVRSSRHAEQAVMLKMLRPALARVLEPAGRALARTPLTPNAVTVIGTLGVMASALILFPAGELFPGAAVCT